MLGKRQIWLLRGLVATAALELVVGWIALQAMRSREVSTHWLPWLDAAGLILTALLLVGGASLVIWIARAQFTAGEPVMRIRATILVLLVLLFISGIAHLALGDIALLNLARYGIAAILITLIAVDSQLYGTSLSRVTVGFAAIALLFANIYRVAELHMVLAAPARWLEIGSESVWCLFPIAVSIAIVRRQREDWIALGIALATLLASAITMWVLDPEILLPVAQKAGISFALPSVAYAAATAMFAFVIARSLMTQVIPAQMAWAFIWLTLSGLDMSSPHIQFGATTALAILAWIPPLHLPDDLLRKRKESPAE